MAEVTRTEQIKRAVIGTVISAAVVGAFALLRVSLWDAVVGIFSWLGEPVSVVRWWYGLLLFFLIATLAVVTISILGNLRAPEYVTYVEDVFFGFVWRWKWDSHGAVEDLQWYCLDCDRLCVYDSDIFEQTTTFFCSNCRHLVQRPGNKNQMLNAVRREIHLKLRNGQWKEVVAAQKKVA